MNCKISVIPWAYPLPLLVPVEENIWRGARKKTLSDFWCKFKFSFHFTSEYNSIWKENLAI